MDLTTLSDEELVELAASIAREQDARLPLDPLPWTWVKYFETAPRDEFGPRNDGPPYPNGQLSSLKPRKGFRQDKAAYAHTQDWFPEHDGGAR